MASTSVVDALIAAARQQGASIVASVHDLARKVWARPCFSPAALQAKCMQAWDVLAGKLGSRIVPLVPVEAGRPVTNLIFGSGGFSTGEYQAEQYRVVASYTKAPPVVLQGLVTNKSKSAGCNAGIVASKHSIPVIELDFNDWYRENYDRGEENPVRATRYWFAKDDPQRPPVAEIARRFEIRQAKFHGALGRLISEAFSLPADIISARGYNFQFCSAIFGHQRSKPHVNDTHPADLTYVDKDTLAKRYPGWQSGAIQLMLGDKHSRFRGSLIEVGFMDRVSQIDDLDEGALLALGSGVSIGNKTGVPADAIQTAMKLVDDYVFCTLEPTGLLLAWGITEKPVDVPFQALDGSRVTIKQHAIVVGNKVCSGTGAFGARLPADIHDLQDFLLE